MTGSGKAFVRAAYAMALAVALASVVLIWAKYSRLMYIGRDADLALWISRTYGAWADPLDVTAMNPFQGMVSMLVAINPYFNPGAWALETGLPHSAQLVLSQAIYLLEVTISTFALGRALGFSRRYCLVASMWLAALLFPPFNFMFSLQGWLATAPIYGHTLCLSNLILVALTKIGADEAPKCSFLRAAALNWLFASCVLLLLLALLLAAPFYNAGMLLGSSLAAVLIVLSSRSGTQFLWRVAAGVYIFACCYFLGLFDFYYGAKVYAARFAGPSAYWTGQPGEFLCSAGISCDRFIRPPALTGSHWLHVVAVVGGLAAFASAAAPLSRLGLAFAGAWLALLAYWILVSLGSVPLPQFAPVYFYLMLYPLVALFSLYAPAFLLRRLVPASFPFSRHAQVALPAAVAAAWMGLLFVYGVTPADVRSGLQQPAARASSPIIDVLRKEISLRPGEPYRGAVATVLGVPLASLPKSLGSQSNRGSPDQTPAQAPPGISHDLLDLWWFDIPTLSEYGQGVSIPLVRYLRDFLSHPGDPASVNYAIPSRVNPDILRSMGVRFVVTDRDISLQGMTKIHAEQTGRGTVNLYELSNPNLGTYSPTKVGLFRASEFFETVRGDPRILERQAFASSPEERPLSPAREVRMAFETGGLRVTASSGGFSTILLPVQFSYCYRPAGPSSGKVKIMRANALHTLVVFERELDLQLRWTFSFWRNSACRLRDAEELKTLGLL